MSPERAPGEVCDVLVVGGGPTGLACAIEAGRARLTARVLDKGSLVDTIRRFPLEMVFFTTRELLEIGDVPMAIAAPKPTRADALAYYRAVARHHRLDVRTYERAVRVDGRDLDFAVHSVDRFGRERMHRARKVVVATGYYDHPNLLGVPGEDLPHVAHYYRDAHEAAGLDVVVVGGANSAAEAALDLFRSGARVTLVVRRAGLDESLKYWVRPDLENRIAAGEIAARFAARVARITADAVHVVTPQGSEEVPAAQVYLLTGYHPDVEFLRNLGVKVDPGSWVPAFDPATFESNVAGLYLAGSVTCGRSTSQVFIENGRFHARQLVPHLRAALLRAAPA